MNEWDKMQWGQQCQDQQNPMQPQWGTFSHQHNYFRPQPQSPQLIPPQLPPWGQQCQYQLNQHQPSQMPPYNYLQPPPPQQTYPQQAYSQPPLPQQTCPQQAYSQQQQQPSIDKEILEELKKKNELYQAAINEAVIRTKNTFVDLVNKVNEIKMMIIEKITNEIDENPFSKLLTGVYSGNIPTDAEIRSVLSIEIPQDFGLDEELYSGLYKEIESFKTREGKRRTDIQLNMKAPFNCAWKECPKYVDKNRKYSVDVNNPRIATMNGDWYCSIIGNTPLPLNKVTSWNIKILESTNNGCGIFIGVAPFDINQNECNNYNKCGWYFYCYDSILCSGPPHNYVWPGKKYGPKNWNGRCLHTGDTVGVVMDITKGKLSFALNEVILGVAYEGIPLDKPLVPCVLLGKEGDSIEFDISKVKENVDKSIIPPSNVAIKEATWDSITLTWDKVEGAEFYQIEADGNISSSTTKNTLTKTGLPEGTKYIFRVRTVRGNSVSKWGDVVKGRTLKATDFAWYAWKKCPDYVDFEKKYSIDEKNPGIACYTHIEDYYCTIIGNGPLPLNKVTSWNIKINRIGIFIGVAPSDIDQNELERDLRGKLFGINGWYSNCFCSSLLSGPPHNYEYKKYGPRRGFYREHVHAEYSVGVVMDTTKGELSFLDNGVNYGVAYEGIPLDKPLVPCVILGEKGDSVELIPSEAKENKDTSISVPPNIVVKSYSWDSITLTWDYIKELFSLDLTDFEKIVFYQVIVDENKLCNGYINNAFTKRNLLPNTEHTFRVRAVKGNSVSEWSDVVKGKTLKKSFGTSAWKECPDYLDENKKYFVKWDNPRIITKNSEYYFSTIIGNTPLPPNKVTSWNIKILKSEDNGKGIFIGIAPFDINQNEDNYDKCGWYFGCYESKLYSGLPHNYECKEYGPRKEKGEYVHTGDSIGVVMDTTKGELSFVLDGVNLGVAYKGIPLDKPLVPCVLLKHQNDSVELDPSEVKENLVDNSILIPSNIIAKSNTWDSITLTWISIEEAEFYQIEVDGNKSWDASKLNTFTKRGLLPETEHSFRVRIVKGNKVSKWSYVVKGRTVKAPDFSECVLKECPSYVDDKNKYSVNENNTRIGINITDNYCYCTIIGNTFIPLNKVTSWNIKILKSKDNNGYCICIGIAPFDINQNESYNYEKCGWYFDCYDSKLHSGHPHNYRDKEYGSRKKDGEYVHNGDSVGVVMDTTKGELSFIVGGVNYGIAYEGIPLDKPLVPCVLLKCKGDSVELIISNLIY